ncbi:MAG: hypothetical protein ACQET6_06865 [Bacillota bacterium]
MGLALLRDSPSAWWNPNDHLGVDREVIMRDRLTEDQVVGMLFKQVGRGTGLLSQNQENPPQLLK